MSQVTQLEKLQTKHRATRGWILTDAVNPRERGKHDSLESIQKTLKENPTAYMYVDSKGILCCMTHGGWYVEIPASFWALPKKGEKPMAKLDEEELEKELLENPLKYMDYGEDGGIWCMCYGGYYVRVG